MRDQIVYGPLGPLYVARSDGTIKLLARDAIGSVRAEVNSAGSVTSAFRYFAYGQVDQFIGTKTDALRFAGEYLDRNGFVFLRSRWYDPGAGRFTVRDRWSGAVADPVSLNSYSYAHGNPVLRVDPAGMKDGVADCVTGVQGCAGGTSGPGTGGGSGRGGAGSVTKGQTGVRAAAQEFEDAGWEVLGRGEVTFRTSSGQVRADLVVRNPATNRIYAVEVKTGLTAELSANQWANYAQFGTELVTPVGANAVLAGLTGGVPIDVGFIWVQVLLP